MMQTFGVSFVTLHLAFTNQIKYWTSILLMDGTFRTVHEDENAVRESKPLKKLEDIFAAFFGVESSVQLALVGIFRVGVGILNESSDEKCFMHLCRGN